MDLFTTPAPECARRRVDELTRLLDHYNFEYYMNDNSLVSDYEFDALMRELVELERTYPELSLPTSPARRVGGEINKTFRQVQHRFPMLSLGNTYSIEEIEEFEARTRKLLDGIPFSYTCELKYDGVAIGLTYRHGQLVQAVTRGNGTVGDDITANARTISTIPLRLRGDFPDDFEARGEVVYPFEAFEAMNLQRESEGELPLPTPATLPAVRSNFRTPPNAPNASSCSACTSSCSLPTASRSAPPTTPTQDAWRLPDRWDLKCSPI